MCCGSTHLSVNFNHSLAMARIYFVSAVRAQTDPAKRVNMYQLQPLRAHSTRHVPAINTAGSHCEKWMSRRVRNSDLLHPDAPRGKTADKNGRHAVPLPLAALASSGSGGEHACVDTHSNESNVRTDRGQM